MNRVTMEKGGVESLVACFLFSFVLLSSLDCAYVLVSDSASSTYGALRINLQVLCHVENNASSRN